MSCMVANDRHNKRQVNMKSNHRLQPYYDMVDNLDVLQRSRYVALPCLCSKGLAVIRQVVLSVYSCALLIQLVPFNCSFHCFHFFVGGIFSGDDLITRWREKAGNQIYPNYCVVWWKLIWLDHLWSSLDTIVGSILRTEAN